jgi:hypothetical protein
LTERITEGILPGERQGSEALDQVRLGAWDPSTAVLLRHREAKSSLRMTN